MQDEFVRVHSIKFSKPTLTIAPKTFNAVYMTFATSKLFAKSYFSKWLTLHFVGHCENDKLCSGHNRSKLVHHKHASHQYLSYFLQGCLATPTFGFLHYKH